MEQNGLIVDVPHRLLLHCPNGHAEQPPDLARIALRAVNARIPTARTGFGSTRRCAHCKTVLSMPERWTKIPVTLEYPAVLTLTCDVPVSRCPNCGTDQLSKRAAKDLAGAVEKLFAGTPGPV